MSYNTAWYERAASRPAKIGRSDPSASLHFIGKNLAAPDDDADANLSLLAILPLVYPGSVYAALTFRGYEVRPMGGGLYEATAEYSRQDPLFSFDTGGGTQKITQALVQRGVFGASGARYVMQASLTSGSANVFLLGADTTANLTAGMSVTDSGGAVPAGTTIASITDSTHLALSAAATKTTGLTASLLGTYLAASVNVQVGFRFLAIPCSLGNGSTTAEITDEDVTTDAIAVGGSVQGPGIPPGTTVASVVDDYTFTLSAAATADGDATLTFAASGSTTAGLAVGMPVSGPGIPASATVATIVDATHLTLSVPTTRASNPFGSALTVGGADYLSFVPAADPPPDFKGAINVKDDSVEGVEVEVPSGHFELTYHVSPAIITDAYQLLLEAMSGSVNLDVFRSRQPGEVKFLGARGSQKGQEDFEITFRFARNPNATNVKVGAITVPLKLGWDYLWVRYQKSVDLNANIMLSVPQWAVVDQVFPMLPFSALGIGN